MLSFAIDVNMDNCAHHIAEVLIILKHQKQKLTIVYIAILSTKINVFFCKLLKKHILLLRSI